MPRAHTPPPSWFGAGAFGLLMNALVCVRKAVLAVLRTETREFTEAAALAVTLVKSKLRPKKLPEAFPEHWAKAPEELDTTSTSALPPRSSVLAALLVVSMTPSVPCSSARRRACPSRGGRAPHARCASTIPISGRDFLSFRPRQSGFPRPRVVLATLPHPFPEVE